MFIVFEEDCISNGIILVIFRRFKYFIFKDRILNREGYGKVWIILIFLEYDKFILVKN